MGQCSQLFVTAETAATEFGGARRHRIGRHHQWRWGPHMLICAAQVVDYLNTAVADEYYRPTSEVAEGVAAIYGVHRVTGEVSGLSLYDDVSTASADECDNNNGAFLVNLTPEGYTIGFLVGEENDGDLTTITDVDGLMAAFGIDWSRVSQGLTHDAREWAQTVAAAVATLRLADAMGFGMSQDTADRVAAATVAGVKTETLWDTIPRAMPDAAPAAGTRVEVVPL